MFLRRYSSQRIPPKQVELSLGLFVGLQNANPFRRGLEAHRIRL